MTATSAATNVETMYRMMMVFIDPGASALHSALMIRKKTRIGATAFKALTNRVPKSVMTAGTSDPSLGMNSASMAPIASPITIRSTRLTLLYFSIMPFTKYPFLGCNTKNNDSSLKSECRIFLDHNGNRRDAKS